MQRDLEVASEPRRIDDFNLDVFSLAGRRALVTGGNTGLGQAFSVALAAAGADVLAAGLDDDGGETEQLVAGTGRRLLTRRCDLTVPGAAAELVEACVRDLGGLDILVNSAGICLIADVTDFDRGQWDPMVAINLTAVFELSQHAGRHMMSAGGGKIINIASLFSFLGGRRSPAYAATKAGVVGFTKAYCDELAEHNIQVNAIAPGYFATSVAAASHTDPVLNRRIVDHVPAGRWGVPADLQGALVFLASRASDYVNGHVLVVDGGYLVR